MPALYFHVNPLCILHLYFLVVYLGLHEILAVYAKCVAI